MYTTHDLLVRVRLSGGAFNTVNSFDVSGFAAAAEAGRRGDAAERGFGIADAPGTLTVTATVTNEDMDPPCTVSGTVNFEIKEATAPIVSNLRKPPVFKGHPPWLWDSRYWFWVKPGPTGNVSPITVEARAIKRARVPGPRRAREAHHLPDAARRTARRPTGAARELRAYGELICPRHIRTWPDGARSTCAPWAAARCRAAGEGDDARSRAASRRSTTRSGRPRSGSTSRSCRTERRSRGCGWRAAATRGASSPSAASRSSRPLCRAENPLRNFYPRL